MEQWLFSVALKKGAYAFAKAVAGFVLSAKAVALEKKFGITVSPDVFQAAVGSAVVAGLHMGHDWLKMKFPKASFL